MKFRISMKLESELQICCNVHIKATVQLNPLNIKRRPHFSHFTYNSYVSVRKVPRNEAEILVLLRITLWNC